MKLNLNKANKLLSRLRGYSQQLISNVNYDISKFELKGLRENLTKTLTTVQKENNDSIDIIKDKITLQLAIFKTNVTYGVSDILAEIAETKALMSFYSHSSYSNAKVFTSDEIETAKDYALECFRDEKALNTKFTITYDIEENKEEIKELRKELSRLEEELVELNYKTIIDFEFSEKSKEILGL